MTRKLVLVNPVNPNLTGFTVRKKGRFPPLGLGIVAALTPGDWDIEIIDENIAPFAFKEADLVGLTAFTASVRRAYEIARIYREKGIHTVIGGIHASMVPEEAAQHVDTVVVGEAEGVWGDAIADFEAGRIKTHYHGTLPDLTNVPVPRRDLFSGRYRLASIQTARGCPMDCDFCSVTVFNGRRYRQRPVEEVLDELETIPNKLLFFVDDNIIGYGPRGRERALALFTGMIKRKIRKQWLCQASVNFSEDNEVLRAAFKSGCRLAFIGVEAECAEALEDVNKRENLKHAPDTYKKAFGNIRRHGIAVLGSFIYGMDSDTPEALDRRSKYILSGAIDVPQMTFLTALPGTRLFRRMKEEGRLLFTDFPNDWDRYHMAEVTCRPSLMTPQELHDTAASGTYRIYAAKTLRRMFFRTWLATRRLSAAIWALSSYRIYQDIYRGLNGA